MIFIKALYSSIYDYKNLHIHVIHPLIEYYYTIMH